MVELIAHRGAAFDAPENSLEAFELALRQGADRLELDVRLTRDGVPVVCHDAGTGRTAEPVLTVADCRLDELREVRLRNGERIPTLDEVCERVAGRVPLDVEIKDARRATAAAVLECLGRHGLTGRSLVTAFDEPPLLELRRRGYGGRLGLLVGSRSTGLRQRAFEAWPLAALARVEATDLVIHVKLAHRPLCYWLRRRGLGLVLWVAIEDEMTSLERCRELYRRAAALEPLGLIVARLVEAQQVIR